MQEPTTDLGEAAAAAVRTAKAGAQSRAACETGYITPMSETPCATTPLLPPRPPAKTPTSAPSSPPVAAPCPSPVSETSDAAEAAVRRPELPVASTSNVRSHLAAYFGLAPAPAAAPPLRRMSLDDARLMRGAPPKATQSPPLSYGAQSAQAFFSFSPSVTTSVPPLRRASVVSAMDAIAEEAAPQRGPAKSAPVYDLKPLTGAPTTAAADVRTPFDVPLVSTMADFLGRRHSTPDQRLFVCPFPQCSRHFSNEYQYKLHLRTHADAACGTFICPAPRCGKEFGHYGKFKAHTRAHERGGSDAGPGDTPDDSDASESVSSDQPRRGRPCKADKRSEGAKASKRAWGEAVAPTPAESVASVESSEADTGDGRADLRRSKKGRRPKSVQAAAASETSVTVEATAEKPAKDPEPVPEMPPRPEEPRPCRLRVVGVETASVELLQPDADDSSVPPAFRAQLAALSNPQTRRLYEDAVLELFETADDLFQPGSVEERHWCIDRDYPACSRRLELEREYVGPELPLLRRLHCILQR